MAVKTLHHNNPADVASAKTLDVPLDDSLHMVIFTGLAQSKTASDTTDFPDRTQDQVLIKLGIRTTQAPKDGEWSATVGLSSVINGDSDLIFATDSVDLQTDGNPNGELELVIDTVALGDGTAVNSFSYQVTVLLREPKAELSELLVGVVYADSNEVTVDRGQPWAYRVGLNIPAPIGGLVVTLESARPDVAPVSDGASTTRLVVVQPGETMSDNFTAPPTANIEVTTPVVITATHDGVVETATVTVSGLEH
jgi:hypothetical protein